MDPRFWQALKANTEKALKESGRPAVRLQGGPMDGWLVADDAPVFRRDWYFYVPGWTVEMFNPGYYRHKPGQEVATWVEHGLASNPSNSA